jgi:hypothetical protein
LGKERIDEEQEGSLRFVFLYDLLVDGILPQIVELARDANDRQTKVAACELLHAIVLYMIGTNAHQPQPVCFLPSVTTFLPSPSPSPH